MRSHRTSLSLVRIGIILVLGLFGSKMWAQMSDEVLHVFTGGSDGSVPAGGVVFDQQGNLYGTTYSGGASGCSPLGECGVVYQLVPSPSGPWTENILHVFQGVEGHDAATPSGGLLIDHLGNLYGVTAYGGSGRCVLLGTSGGCGTVFELSPPSQAGGAWTETILYSFRGGDDGYLPVGDLTFDAHGNIYGATQYGGGSGNCNVYYGSCGVVFKLSPPKTHGGPWIEEVLHAFAGGSTDGAIPNGGVVVAQDGTIYGTTFYGGPSTLGCDSTIAAGCGTAFQLLHAPGGGWINTVIYFFQGPPAKDGVEPSGGLVAGEGGRLYGVTAAGGNLGEGTAFRLVPPENGTGAWTRNLILQFDYSTTGQQPMGRLLWSDGTLYGTVSEGGQYARGTVFSAEPGNGFRDLWDIQILCTFPTGNQAEGPESEVTFGPSGGIYSTTVSYDSVPGGAVFQTAP
jgi:uncharacterized repeat protein (TIGR03803 family)